MRHARAADFKRSVFRSRKFDHQLTEATFDGVPRLGSGSIQFRSGLTAITGLNGVGKSTLMQLLEVVGKRKEQDPEGLALISGGSFRITPSTETTTNIVLIDPTQEAHNLKSVFNQPNLNDLLEPLSPRRLQGESLSEICQLIGRDYESVEVFEIDEIGDNILPYFRVSFCGISYGSESMGHGELALHVLYWQLTTLEGGGILLVEEPENRISTESQLALLNIIAKFSVESKLWIILTTHSPLILSFFLSR